MDILLSIGWSIFDALLSVNQVRFLYIMCLFSTHRVTTFAQSDSANPLTSVTTSVINLKSWRCINYPNKHSIQYQISVHSHPHGEFR
jgi:hypothetical protein